MGANNIMAVASVVIKELYRRKDFYVLFILTALIVLILGAQNIFNISNITNYLKEICLLLIWVSSIAIALPMAARQIPVELEKRTLYSLLSKPITKSEVIIGKFFGCWIATGFCLLVFYAFLYVISISRSSDIILASYFQALVLHIFGIGIIISMTIAGALLFSAPSSNITINAIVVLGIMILGRYLHRFAITISEPAQTIVTIIYYLIPHLEFYDVRELVIHNWNPILWRYFFAACGYAALYIIIFLAIACLLFRRLQMK